MTITTKMSGTNMKVRRFLIYEVKKKIDIFFNDVFVKITWFKGGCIHPIKS